MASKIYSTPRVREFTSSGTVLNGGKLYFYLAGTTTPATVYTSSAMTTAHAHPVLATTAGLFPAIWLAAGVSYDVTCKNSANAVQWTALNYSEALTADEVGRAFYPISDEEEAAGLTDNDLTHQYYYGDVRRYGATGITDDTLAVRAAVDSNDDVLFSLMCILSSQVTVTRENARIHGLGLSTGVTAIDGSFDMLVSEADGVVWENFRVNGGATSQATSQKGISATLTAPARKNTVRNVLFSGATPGEGLNIGIKGDAGCDTWTIEDIRVDRLWGSSTSIGYGVLTGECDGWRVRDSRFEATSGRGRHGVYFSAGSTDCQAVDCDASGFYSSGFTAYTTNAQPQSSDMQFINCRAIDCCTGGFTDDAAIGFYGKIARPVARGCFVKGSGYNGITAHAFLSTMTDATIEDCQSWESARVGCAILGVTRYDILGGIYHESSQSAAGTHGNIDVRTDGTTAATSGSVIGVRSTGSSFARSPLLVNSSAPAPSGLILRGNRFEDGATEGAAFNAIAADTDLIAEKVTTGATPSVAGYNNFVITQGGATNVTAFANAVEGQKITIRFGDGNSTVVDAAGVQLAGGANFTGTADDILVLQYRSSVWYEVSRSVN